ncbi:MAG TPA: Ig-like domain-containing protein, partial [Terriglobales bacterium]|nr:Ig-like domain-containing protein [Terriglobales bacterium]
MRPKVTTVILAVVTIVLIGCGGGSSTPSTPPPQQAQLTAVSISPANSSLPVGRTQQFSATGTYSDGSTKNLTSVVSWRSSNTDIGAISTTGLLSPLSAGKTTISAIVSNLTGSASVTITPAAIVSLSVTCPIASIAFNTEEQCAAIAKLTDGTAQNVSDSV